MKSSFQTTFVYYIFTSVPSTMSSKFEINLYNIQGEGAGMKENSWNEMKSRHSLYSTI